MELEAGYKPHDFLIRITIKSPTYQIKRYQHGDIAVAIGIIFIAQHEMNLPIDQRIVFKKIKTLYPSWDNAKLESVIKAYRLVRQQSSFAVDATEQYSLQSYFHIELCDKLHEIRITDNLNRLAQDLIDNVCRKDNSIWLDIECLFLNYYDGGDKNRSRQMRYVSQDIGIRNCIRDAVYKMQAIERETGETLVETQRKPSHLTNRGLWRIIAYLLVSANTLSGKNQVSPEGLIADNAEIFNGITLSDLQQVVNYYLNGAEYYPTINIEQYCTSQMRLSIKAAVAYVLKNYKDDHLVIKCYLKKYITDQGWQYLRGYLLKHFSTVSSAKEHAKDVSTTISTINKSSITSTHSSKAKKEHEIEMQSITEKIPLQATKDPKSRVINRGYGTNAAAINATVQQSTDAGHGVLPEKAPIHIPINRRALEDCIFSSADILAVVEQFFNVRMVFLSDVESVLKANQMVAMKDKQFVIYLTEGDQYSIDIYIDPFPRCSAYISQRMVTYAQAMTQAQLSKQEIIDIFKPMCPSMGGFFIDFSSAEDKKYSQYAKQIVEKCGQVNSTVEQGLAFIKQILSTITSMADSKKEYNKMREDFLSRADYIFYRSEGKSCAEIAELNNSVALQHSGIEKIAELRSKPGGRG